MNGAVERLSAWLKDYEQSPDDWPVNSHVSVGRLTIGDLRAVVAQAKAGSPASDSPSAESAANRECAIIKALRSAVIVNEGNTESSECYFEVKFLGRSIWDCGGSWAIVKPAAAAFAEAFRRKLERLVRKS